MASYDALRAEFEAFAAEQIAPFADEWDRNGAVPESAIRAMAEAGFLGLSIPEEFGGRGLDQRGVMLLNMAVGEACSSMRSLLTVHLALVSETIARWGTPEQKTRLLPDLASGRKIAAFALSEPLTGSDAKNVHTRYVRDGDRYRLTGRKKWTTFGQRADLFLVVADGEEGVCAFLLDRSKAGKSLLLGPLDGMLGTRASLVAEMEMSGCAVDERDVLGRRGLGFLQIVNTALDNGRFSVAAGCVGIARAALRAAAQHANTREQFGSKLRDFQLIRRRAAAIALDARTAALLCEDAAALRDGGSPKAIMRTAMAKYHASAAANRAADHAVQIHGALGCHESSPVQRYFRDARVMEIIEGSTEMQELLIGEQAIKNPDLIID